MHRITRSKCRLWVVAFHAEAFLDLDLAGAEGRLMIWVVVFLVLAERLGGGGGGVGSTGDREDLVDEAWTSGASAGSLARGRTCSDTFLLETSSGSTTVSAGVVSRLSSVSTASESTRVPLAPEEVMEGDLSWWIVDRMGGLKRIGGDEGD